MNWVKRQGGLLLPTGCAFVVMLLIVVHLFRTNIRRIAPLNFTNAFWYFSTYFCLWTSAWIAVIIPQAITYFRFLGGFGVVQTGILIPYILSIKTTESLTKKIFISLFSIPLMAIAISAAVEEVIS